MNEIVVACTTLPGDFDAIALARELVADKFAACVTVLPPVRSIYHWEGTVAVDHEQQLLIKTTREGVGRLWDALRARHPYDVPEFLVLPVLDGNPTYLQWVADGVRSSG
jgi:periplasmic divalent cation tolerance protein